MVIKKPARALSIRYGIGGQNANETPSTLRSGFSSAANQVSLAWAARPPLRPASTASCRSLEKLRLSFGTLFPPLRASSRRRSGSREAKPRRAGLRGASGISVLMREFPSSKAFQLRAFSGAEYMPLRPLCKTPRAGRFAHRITITRRSGRRPCWRRPCGACPPSS
jgi:hypothetical protein